MPPAPCPPAPGCSSREPRMTNRVLVVVLAETRAHEVTFGAFKQNLLDRLGADLALCVGDGPRETHNPFYEHAKYVWKFPESRMDGAEDWSAALDEMAEGRNWRCLLEVPDGWIGGIKDPAYRWPGTGHFLIAFREFLRRQMETAGVLDRYDWFLITRSDMMYPIPHPDLDLFSPEYVWVPDGERWGGFTDRHMLIPARFIRQVLDLTRDIFERPEDLARRLKARNRTWSTEGFLKFHFAETGLLKHVRFSPYFMYLVRAPDGPTRWSEGDYNAQLRVFIKYRREYTSSIALQAVVAEPADWRHLIGWRRFFNWRMYAYCLMRTGAERYEIPARLRFLRMVRRFFVLLLQPVDTGAVDRVR